MKYFQEGVDDWVMLGEMGVIDSDQPRLPIYQLAGNIGFVRDDEDWYDFDKSRQLKVFKALGCVVGYNLRSYPEEKIWNTFDEEPHGTGLSKYGGKGIELTTAHPNMHICVTAYSNGVGGFYEPEYDIKYVPSENPKQAHLTG